MAADVVMPQMGESIFEGTITKWLKKPGDKVERDEPLFEISTDKVDAEIPSPSAGVLKEIKVAEGQTVPINTVVAVIDAAGSAAQRRLLRLRRKAAPAPAAAAPAAPKPTIVPPPAAQPAVSCSRRQRRERSRARSTASPLVRRMAKEHGIDLTTVPGTGAGGRISKQDMEAVISGGARPAAPAAAAHSRGFCTCADRPPSATSGSRTIGWRRWPCRARDTVCSRAAARRAARAHLFWQLRSRAAFQHAAENRRAHGGVEARFAARLFCGRNRHDQSRRAARQIKGRIRKEQRHQTDLHAVFREGRRGGFARFSNAECVARRHERRAAQGDQHRHRRGARLGPDRAGDQGRGREKHPGHSAHDERPGRPRPLRRSCGRKKCRKAPSPSPIPACLADCLACR